MSTTLVVAEIVDGHLDESTRELVTAALALGGPVALGIATEQPTGLLAETGIAGVDQVVTVQLPPGGFDHEVYRSAVEAMIERIAPKVVLLAFSIRSAAFAGALAESAGLGFAADVIELRIGADGELVAVKPVYGGKVYAEVGFETGTATVVLARPNVWAVADDGVVPSTVAEIDLPEVATRVRHLGYQAPESSGVDLKRAEVVLAIGRGVGSQENIEIFARIAEQLGAVLGASRPLIDAGWLPPAHQVGQTGMTVKPKIYLAFGISGALQHLAGMHASKTIVAVNTDQGAPIFNVADVGAIADINEVAEQIQQQLAARGVSA